MKVPGRAHNATVRSNFYNIFSMKENETIGSFVLLDSRTEKNVVN